MPHSITEFFEQDHARLDKLFGEFQSAAEHLDTAKAIFASFKSGLEQHIEWEEQLLFPEVEQAAGFPANTGPTHVMRLEHIEIKACLALIEDKLNAQQDSHLEQQRLLDVLAQHNMKEERILYPMSDQSISPQTINSILDKCLS